MILEIEIEDEDQVEYLEEVSGQNSISPGQYAQNIVVGWLNSQIKGFYVEHAKKQSLCELKTDVGTPKAIRLKVAELNQKARS